MRDIAGLVSVDVLFQHTPVGKHGRDQSAFVKLSRAMRCGRSSYVRVFCRAVVSDRPWKWTVGRPQGDAIGAKRSVWSVHLAATQQRPHLQRQTMSKLLRGLAAGYGAKKMGGGCFSTVLIFILLWWLLGHFGVFK